MRSRLETMSSVFSSRCLPISLNGSLNLNKPVTITNNTGNLVQIKGLEASGNTINVQADVTMNHITLISFDTALTVAKNLF